MIALVGSVSAPGAGGNESTSLTLEQGPQAPDSIPTALLRTADSILVSRVGIDFFRNYLALDSTLCSFQHVVLDHPHPKGLIDQEPHWVIAYTFRIPEKPFIDQHVSLNIGLDGTLRPFPMRHTIAIPDCVQEPRECEFPIDEAAAMEIARKEGLEPGLKSWKAGFTWHGDYGFIWGVRNTLSSEKQGCIESGKTVTIDANTGLLVRTLEWYSICSRIRKPK